MCITLNGQQLWLLSFSLLAGGMGRSGEFVSKNLEVTGITGKTHLLAGGLAAALSLQLLHAPQIPWIAGVVLGAASGLLPDVDSQSSMASHLIPGYAAVHSGKAGRLMAILSLLVAGPWAVALLQPAWVEGLPAPLRALAAWGVTHLPPMAVLALPALAILFLLLAWILHHVVHHRGATHSLAALAGVYFLTHAYLDRWTALAIFAGYGSHLLADLITKEGDCLAWPLYRHPVGLGHIPGLRVLACKTGGPVEQGFWRPLVITALVVVIGWHVWASGVTSGLLK